jgi:hypothetical protein
MPFEPPFRQYQPGDLVFGPLEHSGGLIAFFRASRWLPAAYLGPVAHDDLADFVAPAASVDPLSAAFHAAARAERKFQEVFDLDLPARFRDRQRAKAGLYWCSIGGGPFAHYSLGGASDIAAMRDIVEKKADDDAPPGKFDPVVHAPITRFTKSRSATGAELRWLYRHRQVAAVRGRVQFWRQDGDLYIPCPPPWDWPGEVGAAWMTYVPTRVYIDADYPTQFTQQP